MKVSIIIPTHNRVESLLRTLQSVYRLKFPKKDYETIIVENVCNDGTKYRVKNWIKKNRIENMKLLSENLPGVHYARNSGAISAKSEILIFIDDDVLVTSNLLTAYLSAFEKNKEMVAAGGKVLPKWETRPPKWLIDFIGKKKTFFILGLMNPYDEFQLRKDGFFFSNNMAIRKKILFQFGGFHPELVGSKYVGDGEAGLNRRLWEKRLRVGYIPEACVYHVIPKNRMTLDYFVSRTKNEGRGSMYTELNHMVPTKLGIIYKIVTILLSHKKLWPAYVIRRGKTDVNALNIQLQAQNMIGKMEYLFELLTDAKLVAYVRIKKWL